MTGKQITIADVDEMIQSARQVIQHYRATGEPLNGVGPLEAWEAIDDLLDMRQEITDLDAWKQQT